MTLPIFPKRTLTPQYDIFLESAGPVNPKQMSAGAPAGDVNCFFNLLNICYLLLCGFFAYPSFKIIINPPTLIAPQLIVHM